VFPANTWYRAVGPQEGEMDGKRKKDEIKNSGKLKKKEKK
jgi:hypothetical protein